MLFFPCISILILHLLPIALISGLIFDSLGVGKYLL